MVSFLNFACLRYALQGTVKLKVSLLGNLQHKAVSLKEILQEVIFSSFQPKRLIHQTQPYQSLTITDIHDHWSNVKHSLGSVLDFSHSCIFTVCRDYKLVISSHRLAWHNFTLNQFPGIMVIWSPARMHSLLLAIYESAVLKLSKQETILSAHSMYKVLKTVFTLQYNCLPEAHSFHPTEHSGYFIL